MARLCIHCSDEATVSVSVLAPTGETITDDTGTAPVLHEVLGGDLCGPCSALAGLASTKGFVIALGGHVDITDVDDVPESADGLTAAKVLAESGFEIIERTPDGFAAVIR